MRRQNVNLDAERTVSESWMCGVSLYEEPTGKSFIPHFSKPINLLFPSFLSPFPLSASIISRSSVRPQTLLSIGIESFHLVCLFAFKDSSIVKILNPDVQFHLIAKYISLIWLLGFCCCYCFYFILYRSSRTSGRKQHIPPPTPPHPAQAHSS